MRDACSDHLILFNGNQPSGSIKGVGFFDRLSDNQLLKKKSVPRNYLFKVDKGKFVPVLFLTEHHPMKAYWGSGIILDLGTRWR